MLRRGNLWQSFLKWYQAAVASISTAAGQFLELVVQKPEDSFSASLAVEVSPTRQDSEPEITLEFDNVTKVFGDRKVFDRLSFKIRKLDKFVVLLGPSGCGKTTVLKLISGLLREDDGKVRINVSGEGRRSATVPQAYTCFPWLTVKQNVAFGLALQGKAKDDRERSATEYLDKVGLAAVANYYPKQLSGGMQQRVAIARTLVVKPRIVLMDEPFGALDAQTREEMQKMLLKLHKEEESTIIFVTHDIAEALLLANRIIVFGSASRIIHDMDLEPEKFSRLLGRADQADNEEFRKINEEFLKETMRIRELLRPTTPAQQAATTA